MMPWRTARRRLNPRCSSDTDTIATIVCALRADGVRSSMLLGVIFALLASAILLLRADVISHRPGQFLSHDIVARASFDFVDDEKLDEAKRQAAIATPRVFKDSRRPWDEIQQNLLSLPDRVKGQRLEDLKDVELSSILDPATLDRLKESAADDRARATWDASVKAYVNGLRGLDLIVIDDNARAYELSLGRDLQFTGGIGLRAPQVTFSPSMGEAIYNRVATAARDAFPPAIWPKVALLTKTNLCGAPTHVLDDNATKQAENQARAAVTASQGVRHVERNQVIVATRDGGEEGRAINESDYGILKAENRAYRESLGNRSRWLEYAGIAGSVCLITLGIAAYVAKFAPRIIRNHARGVSLAALLLCTLLIAGLTGIGTGKLYFAGVAPTILVAMVLSIAYDQRFAIGVAALHAVLATMAVGQGLPFFVVLIAGSAVCCFATEDLRGRSRLIEIGGLTGFALMLATAFAGMIHGDPWLFVWTDALFAAAAGLSVGFIVLGILPFVERAFRITTSMTLLELADTGHPLLRKLAQEAPGTYNHSMQVATLAEEASEAIGGKALLARVGAYYHDIGKMNKAEYFIENQTPGQPNRHMALSPNVSMLIIVGHVKDGIELARQFNLPTVLFPFIQSHHGTTLIEYFYRRAKQQEEARIGETADVSEHQFRYPGPRPRSKEVGIVMIADAVESICRTLDEPNASRIESVVADVIEKRLKDGQFDECEITMRELHQVEKSLIRTLLGIYHARIAYPSNARPDTSSTIIEPATTSIGEIKSA